MSCQWRHASLRCLKAPVRVPSVDDHVILVVGPSFVALSSSVDVLSSVVIVRWRNRFGRCAGRRREREGHVLRLVSEPAALRGCGWWSDYATMEQWFDVRFRGGCRGAPGWVGFYSGRR